MPRDHVIKRSRDFECWVPPPPSYHSAKFLILQKYRYKVLHLSRDQKVTCRLLTVSYHSTKFDGHRYCESADISFFICPVTT